MNPVETNTPGMRRLKVLCIMVIGAFIPLSLDMLREILAPVTFSGQDGTWRAYLAPGAILVTAVVTAIVAYRVVRYSKLPGVPVIIGMILLVWVLALLGHFS